jgi:hypothetical protein
MKLPENFPHKINEAKVNFATRPQCPSSISDIESKVITSISYYALGKHYNWSKFCLFSLDDHLKVVGHEFFSTVEQAMSSLEPDGLTPGDWKFVKS